MIDAVGVERWQIAAVRIHQSPAYLSKEGFLPEFSPFWDAASKYDAVGRKDAGDRAKAFGNISSDALPCRMIGGEKLSGNSGAFGNGGSRAEALPTIPMERTNAREVVGLARQSHMTHLRMEAPVQEMTINNGSTADASANGEIN